jgi:hypothetical protein
LIFHKEILKDESVLSGVNLLLNLLDDKAILYTKMSTADPSSNMLLKDMKAMLHVIGTDTKADKVLASREDYPRTECFNRAISFNLFYR